MASKRKTVRGEKFTSVATFIEWVLSGYYTYHHDKPIHPGWACGWQLGMVCRYIHNGSLYECLDARDLQPYTSSSLEALAKDMDLSEAEKAEVKEGDRERRKQATSFYRSIHRFDHGSPLTNG